MSADWSGIVGQEEAVAHLEAALRAPVHAYLLVGPAGTGKRIAARIFAGELLAASAPDPERARRLARSEEHPDLVVVERKGPFITVDQAKEVVRLAHRSPGESDRKVLVLVDFHLVLDAAPMLLKTIEEPPASTVFVVLADEVTPELVTIASRCVRVDFRPLGPAAVSAALEAEGIDADTAAAAAAGAGGNVRRARLLAADPDVRQRRAAWHELPDRLDGTGSAVAVVVDELFALIDRAAEPLEEAQRAELEEWERRAEMTGERKVPKELTDRHKREQRRLRVDELRAGLGSLADRLRADAGAGASHPEAVAVTLGAIVAAEEALTRNPNERLLLENLLLHVA